VTTRLLTIISGQPLPNYIAINEIRPDVVHYIYTPKHGGMADKLKALQSVVGRKLPDVRFELHPVDDPFDAVAIWSIGFNLLQKHDTDRWLLNRTAGTEQMRMPLAAAFEKAFSEPEAFFVETERNQITFIKKGWIRDEYEFDKGGISVQDYFALHGQVVSAGQPTNPTEQHLYTDLQRLAFDDIAPSCTWLREGNKLAEYDIAATFNYRLYVFERKKLAATNAYTRTLEEQDAAVLHDIEKLAYTRAIFGGPFGKVYWLLSGGYVPKGSIKERMKVLGIQYVEGTDITHLANHYEKNSLPAFKIKTPKAKTSAT
jgi:hypothetical protein